ncbi:hypothetical protein VTO42DRAFT_8295 [Malbranchea cinnamomea]
MALSGGSPMNMAAPPGQPVQTIVYDTPSNRRGVYSKNPEDASTYPPNVEPALAAMVPEATPRIYRHCVMGLASGIPREVDFALHHMVIISDERGDKFRFRDFPQLAERLTDKVLEISKWVHGVEWEIDWDLPKPNVWKPVNTLNAVIGTHDLLERLKRLPVKIPKDDLEGNVFGNELRLMREASLILRNMVQLEDNARWVHDIDLLRDCATIVLTLPEDDRWMEIKNNMLEVVEQACPYWQVWEDADPLCTVLLTNFLSDDRFRLLISIKSFCVFGLGVGQQKATWNVPWPCISKLLKLYLLTNDPEMLSVVLDFFYQFTLEPKGVQILKEKIHLPTTMIKHMVNLLTYDANPERVEYIDRPEKRAPPPREIPMPPPDLFNELMRFPEPERTARWLKCCFVEDAECEVTQLALWHAYQNVFSEPRAPGVYHFSTLQATEFISTVTSTFPLAEAKIVEGPSAKFIIKGIRPLETAYDLNGFPYHFCKWGAETAFPCLRYFKNAQELKDHVWSEHLQLRQKPNGKWGKTHPDQTAMCLWDDCYQIRIPQTDIGFVFKHVSWHLPQPPENPNVPPPIPERPIITGAMSRIFDYYDTPTEHDGTPYGIAYKAALILRNIQYGLGKEKAGKKHKNRTWTRVMFGSIRSRLIEIADLNRSLRGQLLELVADIDRDS